MTSNLCSMTRLIALGAMCLLLAACRGENTPPSDLQKNLSAEKAPKALSSEEAIPCYLMPLPVTKERNLRVIVSGFSSRPDYHWYVNGREVDEVHNSELSSDYYSKGDEVMVVVNQGAKRGQVSSRVVNSPPRLVTASVTCGLNSPIVPETIDPDGDEVRVRYLWFINGQEATFTENMLTSSQVSAGDRISLQIFISDGEIELPVFECNEIEVSNSSPSFVTAPPLSFSGNIYDYQAKAIDPEGTTVSYQLNNGPDGMSIDHQSGTLSWPITAECVGEHKISIIATDEDGQQIEQSFILNLSLPGPS